MRDIVGFVPVAFYRLQAVVADNVNTELALARHLEAQRRIRSSTLTRYHPTIRVRDSVLGVVAVVGFVPVTFYGLKLWLQIM